MGLDPRAVQSMGVGWGLSIPRFQGGLGMWAFTRGKLMSADAALLASAGAWALRVSVGSWGELQNGGPWGSKP